MGAVHILIAGGGIIGASLAFELAHRGASVTIFETATLGSQASWAGAGMLVPASEFDEPCPAMDFALESLALYPEFVARLEAATAVPIDFSLCGSLEVAATETEWAHLQERARKHRLQGIPNQTVTASDLAHRVPVLRPNIAGAILYPQEGQVDPRTITQALRAAFLNLPVQLREHTTVAALECGTHTAAVVLQNGERIEADRVVLAAGAWSSLIPTGFPLPRVYPVKGHLIGYRRQPASLPHVIRYHHTYLVQRRDGYTIAGTSVEQKGFDRSVDPATATDIATRAAALAPGLLDQSPSDIWTGFRPGTDSAMPHLGRHQDTTLWLATGHYRNGILLAPATARRLAATLL